MATRAAKPKQTQEPALTSNRKPINVPEGYTPTIVRRYRRTPDTPPFVPSIVFEKPVDIVKLLRHDEGQ
jgi:hypothetical protein